MGKSKAKTKKLKSGGRRQSNKKDKTAANQLFRRKSRVQIHVNPEEENKNLPILVREVLDVWDFSSDGLAIYDSELPEKYMRK